MRRATTILSCFLAVALAGCASSASTSRPTGAAPAPTTASTPTAAASTTAVPSAAPSALGLAGQWNGTWQNTTPDHSGGTFALTWTQTGSNLSGTITIAGTPCLTGGTVTGTISGDSISFGAVSGQVQVAYDGHISDGRLEGTYTTTCGNAKGTWAATR